MTKKKFLINELSVVIPVYNGERTIEKCLKGILNQLYFPQKFEVVVVNDGSTDRTKEIAEGFPVRLINFSKNKGRITARDIGVRKAKYKYIQFLDADCIPKKRGWLKNTLAQNYQPIQGQVVNVSDVPVDRFLYLMRKLFYKFPKKPIFIEKKDFLRFPKGLGNFLCSKELYNQVKFPNKGEYFSDDQHFIYELSKQQRILTIPEIIIHQNERPSFQSHLVQWFQRGNRFADFYLRKDGILTRRFYLFISIFLFVSLILTYYLSLQILLFVYLFTFVNLLLLVAFIGAEKIQDLLLIVFYLPIISLMFCMGLLKRKFL